MVAYTGAGAGRLKPGEEMKLAIEILSVDRVVANVRIVSLKFTDHCHLARLDGEWKIVNVVWEPAARRLRHPNETGTVRRGMGGRPHGILRWGGLLCTGAAARPRSFLEIGGGRRCPRRAGSGRRWSRDGGA